MDAIPPATLRFMARHCIEQHIDRGALSQTQRIEAQERAALAAIQERMGLTL